MLLELQNLGKSFGEHEVLHDVTAGVERGDRIGIIGANGTGKTTLLRILCGESLPDAGDAAFGTGVTTGYLEQNARLDPTLDVYATMKLVFTPALDAMQQMEGLQKQLAADPHNAELTDKIAHCTAVVDAMDAYNMDTQIKKVLNGMGFPADTWTKAAGVLSGGEQTRLRLARLLLERPDILILDEPTAVLTPQETEKLFSVIRNMKADGKAVIIITHKLHEVLSISDRVAILRKGEYVGDIATKDADEAKLTEMMVGEKVELNIERPEPVDPVKRLELSHLTVRSADGITVLDDASFTVYGGEILGIAGISGNGQKELLEAIAGLQPTESGASIEYFAPNADTPVQLVGKSPKAIREAGIHLSFVPEDRLGMGLVGSMGMTDNMMLKSYGKGHSPIVDRKAPLALAETIKRELGVVTPDLNTPVSRLSGGNVQKVLVGRELAADPIVLMTAYAVRGLDINTSYTIYHLLNEQKKRGVAVIYVGEDLDVLLELCDRIVVLCGGKVNGILDGRHTTKEEVGLRMTNLVKEEQA